MGFHHVEQDGLNLLTSWSTLLGLPKCWDYRRELLCPARNASDFCTLVLCTEILLKLFISLRSFWAEIMWCLYMWSYHLQTDIVWLPLYLDVIYFFLLTDCSAQDFRYYVELEWWERASFSCAGFQGKWFQLLPIQHDTGYGFVIDGSYYFDVSSLNI